MSRSKEGGINELLGAVPEAKVKSKKPKVKTTLEAHHNQQIEKLANEREQLPTLKQEVADLEAQLAELNPTNFDEKQRITDIIRGLKERITQIESGEKEFDYYLDVGDLLFSYFDPQKEKKAVSAKHMPANSIMRFYMEEEERKKEEEEGREGEGGEGRGEGRGEGGEGREGEGREGRERRKKASTIDTSIGKNRDKLLEHYLATVDIGAVKDGIHPDAGIEVGWDSCPSCESDMSLQATEAKLICSECGFEMFVLIDSDKPSYKDAPRENTYFAYKKINHFNEWLAQFQAKDNTLITQEMMEAILAVIQKERITNPLKIKKEKIAEILRKLKFTKLYDHVPLVKNRIQQNITHLTLSKEQEERLQHVFKEIQPSFIKYCPDDRSNFLSYPFVLYKLCQLLEMDEFLPCFNLLKDRVKLYNQDKVWQMICADMRWQFIRSV